MIARSFIIAAMLTAAPAAYAEPSKPQGQAANQASSRPLVLASAEAVKAPVAAGDQQAAAKRPRVARVTTCRCGDPQPADDQPDQ